MTPPPRRVRQARIPEAFRSLVRGDPVFEARAQRDVLYVRRRLHLAGHLTPTLTEESQEDEGKETMFRRSVGMRE